MFLERALPIPILKLINPSALAYIYCLTVIFRYIIQITQYILYRGAILIKKKRLRSFVFLRWFRRSCEPHGDLGIQMLINHVKNQNNGKRILSLFYRVNFYSFFPTQKMRTTQKLNTHDCTVVSSVVLALTPLLCCSPCGRKLKEYKYRHPLIYNARTTARNWHLDQLED